MYNRSRLSSRKLSSKSTRTESVNPSNKGITPTGKLLYGVPVHRAMAIHS
ncbi:MAG TPA: hypothetical protein HA298_01450 [Methanobacteriales archaeon]|nr:hypothetical protein [Methanobacteriaceae archaeon]MBC7096955.1 hypothetical protein [Methanobacteriales archaeon]HIH61341.1 hypothetical protein [Methanobacteriales archaeon]